MEFHERCRTVVRELGDTLDRVNESRARSLAEAVAESSRVFLAGAGRSGLAVKAFAMRLMHMGFETYVVGETVTPGIERGDLLIIGSGSGATDSLVAVARKAKSIGARLALVTTAPDSHIGRLADVTVTIPAPTPKLDRDTSFSSVQPMGSLFEQSQLIFYDALILHLMEMKGIDADAMFDRHSNLE